MYASDKADDSYGRCTGMKEAAPQKPSAVLSVFLGRVYTLRVQHTRAPPLRYGHHAEGALPENRRAPGDAGGRLGSDGFRSSD